MTEPTQGDCKRLFLEALNAFVDELDDIDSKTPWSNTEPTWWLDMLKMHKSGTDILRGDQS